MRTHAYLILQRDSLLSCLEENHRKQFEEWKKDQSYDLHFYDEDPEVEIHVDEAKDIAELQVMIDEVGCLQDDSDLLNSIRKTFSFLGGMLR